MDNDFHRKNPKIDTSLKENNSNYIQIQVYRYGQHRKIFIKE